MPLPTDEHIVALAKDLLEQFDQIFGMHPGFRAAHAKGLMLTGTFRPHAQGQSLTRTPHASRASTPVTASSPIQPAFRRFRTMFPMLTHAG